MQPWEIIVEYAGAPEDREDNDRRAVEFLVRCLQRKTPGPEEDSR